MFHRTLIAVGALMAAAAAAPADTRAAGPGVDSTPLMSAIERQEARWVYRRYCRTYRRCFTRVRVRRICRPYRRCFTRWRVYRRPIRRRVCRRFYRNGRWYRRCFTRVVYRTVRRPYRVCRVHRRCRLVRRPYRVCRPYRRCWSRRVWVN